MVYRVEEEKTVDNAPAVTQKALGKGRMYRSVSYVFVWADEGAMGNQGTACGVVWLWDGTGGLRMWGGGRAADPGKQRR